MSDITMCLTAVDCKLNKFCRRYTDRPDELQSYCTFNSDHNLECDWFLPNKLANDKTTNNRHLQSIQGTKRTR